MEASDAVLVGRARQGDAVAFDALVRRHLSAAYAVALARLGEPADAEDVCRDAFVAALQRLDECRQPDRFGSWLLQIVRNRAHDHARAQRVRTATPLESIEVASTEATPLGRARLMAAGLLLLAFVAGALGGVAADRLLGSDVPTRERMVVRRDPGDNPARGPGPIFPGGALADELALTPEQRARIQTILAEERFKADSLMRTVRPILQARTTRPHRRCGRYSPRSSRSASTACARIGASGS